MDMSLTKLYEPPILCATLSLIFKQSLINNKSSFVRQVENFFLIFHYSLGEYLLNFVGSGKINRPHVYRLRIPVYRLLVIETVCRLRILVYLLVLTGIVFFEVEIHLMQRIS